MSADEMRRSLNTPLLVCAGFVASIGLFFASADSARAQAPPECTDAGFTTGQCTGEAGVFRFTVLRFSLRRQDDLVIVPLNEEAVTFNVGSGAIARGEVAGTLSAGVTVTENTDFDQFIVELNPPTLDLRGSVTTPGACRTFTSGSPSDGAAAQTITINMPAGIVNAAGNAEFKATQAELADLPLNVPTLHTVSIDIAFDAGSGVLYTFPAPAGDPCTDASIGPLNVSMSFTIIPPSILTIPTITVQ